MVSLAVSLGLAAVVLARGHCWSSRQRLFSQRIAGLGFARRHGGFLAWSTALWLVCAALAWRWGWIGPGAAAWAGLVAGLVVSGFLAGVAARRDRRECARYLRSA